MEVILSTLIILILSIIFYLLKLPLVLAYMFSGIISSNFINLDSHFIEFINNIAISILLFFIGFEFSFNKIRNYLNSAIFNYFITFILFLILGIFIGFLISKSLKDAFLFSLILYPTSSIIILKILQSTNRLASLETPHIIIGLIVEDLILPFSLGIVFGSFYSSILNIILIIIAIFLNYKYKKFIRNIIGFIISLEKEIFILIIFSSVILLNFLLNSPIGAFIIGILISDTYEKFFENELSSIREIIFITFFFAFGYILKSIILSFALFHILFAILLVILSTSLKYFYFYNVFDNQARIRAILTMVPKGEFSIIAIYLLGNEELKILASLFIFISVVVGSVVSFYAKKIT